MKRRLAILLTVAMLLGMVGFAEVIEVEDEITIDAAEVEYPPDEVELEIGDLDLPIEDIKFSAENDMYEEIELAEDLNISNASEDFDIQDGVLVKYNGPGGDVVIPDGVTRIKGSAFYKCTSLTSVVIPNSVTSIGEGAFRDCTSLTSIVIPNSVTSIEFYTFSHCTSLISIVIPDSVTNIGSEAFSGCTSLTSVDIPNSVTSIGEGAFSDCTSLTNAVIPDRVTSIRNEAFRGCTSLINIVIPDSVKSIGTWAFNSCTSLTSVVIPDSVTSIASYAFLSCTSLTNIVLPDGITQISYQAFAHCRSLTNIVIPDSVTSIHYFAFEFCTGLTSIVIPDSVTSIANDAFRSCDNLTIYGEAGSYAESYANKQGIPFVAGSPTPTPTDPTSITLNRQGIVSMMPKKTLQLKATFEPAESSADLKWESRAPKFAKVNSKGKVTALKKGKTTITATTESGLSASVEIWVGQVPVMIKPIVVRKSDNAVEVSWTPLQGVSGYEVAVGKSKNATNASDISGESKKRAILFVTPGQKLYYRVRGYLISGKKKIYGDWSTSKSFTLKRSAESFPAFGGEQFLGSNNMGDVKYTVSLLDWKHEGRTTTIKTRITFEWKKRPNSFGLDALAMGVSGDFTNEENQATVEYVPWNQVGSTGMKAGGYLTDKPKVERSGKGDGVYIKITPSKVYDTYYETTTVRGVKKKVKKKRYTYATTGSIISTWSVDAPEPVTNFSIVGSYGDNQQKVKVDPSVSFTNGAVKFSVSAKLEENFEEGPLAYAKVKLNVQ